MAEASDTQVVSATAKFVRVSPRKARLVADLVRGKSVPDARAILAFSTRAAALPVRKVLESAAANADHNHGFTADEMVLAKIAIDQGPTIKRYRPRAQGRATSIKKRTCHITIALAQSEQLAGRRAATRRRGAA
jgi:large subunit ribosomal protein L22